MNIKVVTGIAISTGILFFMLAFGYYNRGMQIKTLGAELNASVQAKALCEQKNLNIQNALNTQNKIIEQLRVDKEAAQKAVTKATKDAAVRWQKETQKIYVPNATCEAQLKEIDSLHKTFFGGK